MIKSYNEFIRMNEAIKLPAEGETVQPRDNNELKDIIKATIKERGNKADLNFIDTSKITDMSYIFYNINFNGDISKWDVSKVENMASMFAYSKFTGDISNWKTSKVEIMSRMFDGSQFDGDISKWNVSKVKDSNNAFKDCPLESKPKYQPTFK